MESVSGPLRRRWRIAALSCGTAGLAATLVAAAVLEPDAIAGAAPMYTPSEPGFVVTRVPPRDPAEAAARAELAAAPDRVDLAVALAHVDIQRGRSLSDPRYLGRAQATLGRWWKQSDPPPDVLLLRATIEQSFHDFAASRADLDKLLKQRPDDAQAYLTLAVVAAVTADYATARESCAKVGQLAAPLIALTCVSPVDALAGGADAAYDKLAKGIASAPRADATIREWALTTLGEIAMQRGDDEAAATHLRAALALDPEDAYARAALADALLDSGHPEDASTLLAGREAIDNELVRRAIAEHEAHGVDEAKVVKLMRDRIAAAADRGDRIHLREEARFTLEVEADPVRGLTIARDNWSVQKELADARLLAEAAAGVRDVAAAEPVITWAKTLGVHDAQLDHWFKALAP